MARNRSNGTLIAFAADHRISVDDAVELARRMGITAPHPYRTITRSEIVELERELDRLKGHHA
ncbi:hypothetical protein COO72_02495 [Bifidobacterium callitrichos]|nr:hypothetical protein COO72_02495 [Bifidobacterium callitrichos]